ncbi:coiled-coil domain-containing protein 181 isoform X2 [Amia ocellicauda]|uniref:coiled-coil domain-containing protein 181 isoform X2 n=1 Tax=Amia ocellicauda TaxID=2972642 RepID=UPI0034640FD7
MNEKNEPGSKMQEEYEDDFEKDLDWLINEEGKSENEDPVDEDEFEAQIDKELEEEDVNFKKEISESKQDKNEEERVGRPATENPSVGASAEERPHSPVEPSEGLSDTDSDTSYQLIRPEEGGDEDELDEEAKKYIMEKIQLANRQLEDEEPVDENRERRLKFKDKLVDLVVPPLDYEGEKDAEGDISGRMSEMQISEQQEGTQIKAKEGKVLIEKDGKFDLVSIREVESRGLLPALACAHGEAEKKQQVSTRSSSRHSELCPVHGKGNSSSPRLNSAAPSSGVEYVHVPKPPSVPRIRPNSASHAQRNTRKRVSTRRVQSANTHPRHSTYTLSLEEKELRLKLEQRRERLRREEEAKKRKDDEEKRQENEMAFRAWLMRKREQLQQQKRIYRAKEMERMNNKQEYPDPQEAFKLWLKRKHEQQQKDRQMEEMKRLEEESSYYIHGREECERAYKLWLKRKRAEKQAERLAAKERSRRLVMDARQARRMQDLLCTISEAKSFRFVDNYGYRF